jgi:hypothetical protein
MRFSWDPDKARINLRKHGIRFEAAPRVFSDPLAEWREECAGRGLASSTSTTLSESPIRSGEMTMAAKPSASSRLALPKAGRGAGMSEDDVFFELDVDNPPPLTPEERAEIEASLPKSDDDIDFSDIPRLSEEWFAKAERGPHRPS